MQSIRIIEKILHKKLLVLFFVGAFTLFIMPSHLKAAPVTFDKTLSWTIPDLSQHTIVPQAAYCAPTAATNALWAFYQNGDNTLIQPAATGIPEEMADNTISLLAAASYMAADPVTGTSTATMVSGLQSYADDYGTTKYTVSLLTAFNTGPGGGPGDGQTLWNAMVNELFKCEEVLVIIRFTGPAGSPAEVEDLLLNFDGEYPPVVGKQGHAVTMTGYDNTIAVNPVININDPANNFPPHSWIPESAPLQLDVVAFPDSLLINTVPYAGFWVIGAITMSPVGVAVSAISGDTDEGGTTATFTVVLTSQPTADVTIPITSLDLTEGTVSAATLTFTNANWDSAQTVTVTGVDDALIDGDIAYTVEVGDPTSADNDYDALTNADTADVSVTNLDDDTDTDSDGGGCFIATTANSSPIEPNANILRDYLNRFLLSN